MKKKFKVGDIVEYPIGGDSRKTHELHLIVERRGVYIRLQCIRTGEYYNTIAKWIALPTYSPTPMGLQVNAHPVIKGL